MARSMRVASDRSLLLRHMAEVAYGGSSEEFVRHVCNVARGGQVVLTEQAWSGVQDHLPGQAQVRTRPKAGRAVPIPILPARGAKVHASGRSFGPAAGLEAVFPWSNATPRAARCEWRARGCKTQFARVRRRALPVG
jgi:hypothetical protein